MSIDYQKILLKAKNTNITEYSVKSGTTEISPSAFINCTQLTNINMEESLYSNIGSEAFPTNCKVNNENTLLSASCSDTSFSGRVIIPKGMPYILGGAFKDCSSLTSVTIPKGVTSIWSNVFDGCSSLISITIPEGVTSIGDSAFAGCSSLTSVTIPESVTSIGGWAFSGCSGLTNIILENRTLGEAQSLIGTENNIGYTGTITHKDGTYNTTFYDSGHSGGS